MRIVCFGGAVMDRKYHAIDPLIAGTSNPVTSVRAYGGVARNVAENLARLDVPVTLVSAVGDDESGHGLLQAMLGLGVDVSGVAISAAHGTAEYAAVLEPDNSLAFGIADMAVFEALTVDKLTMDWPKLNSADWVFADCNLPAETLHELISRAAGSRLKLAIDAVSVHKAAKLPADLSSVTLLFLNREEYAVLGSARGAGAVVMTLGGEGVLLSDAAGSHPLPAPPATVRDVTGAGDSLIAGTLFGLQQGHALAEAVKLGLRLAKLTIETDGSVRQDLTPDLLKERA